MTAAYRGETGEDYDAPTSLTAYGLRIHGLPTC